MAIPLTGASALFTRLGKLGAPIVSVDLFRGYGQYLISSISGNATTITVTTVNPHGFLAGDTVVIQGSNIAGYNSTPGSPFTIASITSATVFTITNSTVGTNTSVTVYAYKNGGNGFFSIGAYLDNVEATYQSPPVTGLPTNAQLIDGIYSQRSSYIGVHGQVLSYLQSVFLATIIKMANDDTKLVSQDIVTATNLLITQMKAAAQSVQQPTITTTIAPPVLGVPTLSSATVAAGGSLAQPQAYFYKITAIGSVGETTLSVEKTATTSSGNQTINLVWVALTGAAGYRIYRGTATNAENILVATVTPGSATTFSDTGAATVASALPTTNTASSNAGGDFAIASSLNNQGVQQDYEYTENIAVTCTADSQGSATQGSEPYSVVGAIPENDPLMWDWPLGSGANTSLTVTNPQLSNNINLLFNSAFSTFTVANVPDNWTVTVGVPGTSVLSGGAGQSFTGTNCLEFVGDGATLHAVTQQFNVTTGGTPAILQPSYSTVLTAGIYASAIWIKLSATPAAGTLAVELIDQNGNVINNNNAVANQLLINLTTVPASEYLPFGVFFQMPTNLPTTQRLRLRMSVALSNGVNLFIGQVGFAAPPQSYTGGPWVDVFHGAGKALIGDNFVLTIANQYNSQWQKLFQRVVNMTANGLQLPSSGSPTIADSLIA